MYNANETGKSPYLFHPDRHLQVWLDAHDATFLSQLKESRIWTYSGETGFKTFFLRLIDEGKIKVINVCVPIPVKLVDAGGKFVRNDSVDFEFAVVAETDESLEEGSIVISRYHMCVHYLFPDSLQAAKAVSSFVFSFKSGFLASCFVPKLTLRLRFAFSSQDVIQEYLRRLAPPQISFAPSPINYHARNYSSSSPDSPLASTSGGRMCMLVSHLAKREKDSKKPIPLSHLQCQYPRLLLFLRSWLSSRQDLVAQLVWEDGIPNEVRASPVSQTRSLMMDKAKATRELIVSVLSIPTGLRVRSRAHFFASSRFTGAFNTSEFIVIKVFGAVPASS